MAVGLLLVGLAILALVLLVTFTIRRRVLMKGVGAIEMSFRLQTRRLFGGWALGVGWFSGDQLLWYRVFSFTARPARRLDRRSLLVEARRGPGEDELGSVPLGAVILQCTTRSGHQEIAMNAETVPGFMSWLEASPPPGYPLPGPGVAAGG